MPETMLPTTKLETRGCVEKLSVRAASKGKMPLLEGYAAVWGSLSEELFPESNMYERIMSGAFAESLERGDDIRALIQHNQGVVVGRRSAGTLELSEDDRGLAVRIKPPPTQTGKDLVESIRRGDLAEMSFGFLVPDEDAYRWVIEGDLAIREMIRLDLYEVSIVGIPQYAATDVKLAQRSFRVAQVEVLRARVEQQAQILQELDKGGGES
jgi:HK97 family phage prohead protease